jgi:3-oxoacyl-[acyl-carrier-protein] synthase II
VEELWSGLLDGKCGANEIRSFNTDAFHQKIGCEIHRLDDYLLKTSVPIGRTTQMLQIAIEDALYDARISLKVLANSRVGLCVGTTMGEIGVLEEASRAPSVNLPLGGPDVIGTEIARHYALQGPVWTMTNACAAGNYAIARAMDELWNGNADIMIVGGVDMMSRIAFMGFHSLRALSPDLCRPFDANRKGLLLGEGAGVLVLETKEHSMLRNAKPRSRLVGYGMTGDAHHITQPDPTGKGAVQAMQLALEMAGLNKDQIGYVSAHGTGTLSNDAMEMNALHALYGERIFTSSIKGHIGHTLGAASAIEAVVSVKALETGILPPTLHHRRKDNNCRVQIIANEPKALQTDYIMSNAYAFGGVNTSVVIGKVG